MTAQHERKAAAPGSGRESAGGPGPHAASPRRDKRKEGLAWLGLLPFFLFVFAFMILPAASIFTGSFQDAEGHFTFRNIVNLFKPNILGSYLITVKVSATTAALGGVLGFLIAYAISLGGLPKPLRSFMSTFSGVASNFAGVPLAFAFIATLGRMGFLTVFIKTFFGFDLYEHGFTINGARNRLEEPPASRTGAHAPLGTMTVPQPISPANIRRELKSILKMLDND